jgi:hypothetical protein
MHEDIYVIKRSDAGSLTEQGRGVVLGDGCRCAVMICSRLAAMQPGLRSKYNRGPITRKCYVIFSLSWQLSELEGGWIFPCHCLAWGDKLAWLRGWTLTLRPPWGTRRDLKWKRWVQTRDKCLKWFKFYYTMPCICDLLLSHNLIVECCCTVVLG